VLTWSSTGNNWIARNLTATISVTGSNSPVYIVQPYLAVNYCICLYGIYPSRNTFYDATIGEIGIFAGNFAPKNFAFCDGQTLAISVNSALFSILGTTYGGDGMTTFKLPDLRSRVPIHAGSGAGPGLSQYTLGDAGGAETVTLTLQNLPAHNHFITFTGP
jgi:microcystin-dependent protein